jgi:hypothetical protein
VAACLQRGEPWQSRQHALIGCAGPSRQPCKRRRREQDSIRCAANPAPSPDGLWCEMEALASPDQSLQRPHQLRQPNQIKSCSHSVALRGCACWRSAGYYPWLGKGDARRSTAHFDTLAPRIKTYRSWRQHQCWPVWTSSNNQRAKARSARLGAVLSMPILCAHTDINSRYGFFPPCKYWSFLGLAGIRRSRLHGSRRHRHLFSACCAK